MPLGSARHAVMAGVACADEAAGAWAPRARRCSPLPRLGRVLAALEPNAAALKTVGISGNRESRSNVTVARRRRAPQQQLRGSCRPGGVSSPVPSYISGARGLAGGSLDTAASLQWTVAPLSPLFGVCVEGLDTSRPASADAAAFIRTLLAEHKLLLIKGGKLSPSQLAGLGHSFGLGESERFGASDVVGIDYMSAIEEEPTVFQIEYGPNHAPADINIWHMDHSWHEAPTRYELSYTDVGPAVGGDVEYADACAAYDSLSPHMRDMLENCTCMNLLAHGYQNLDISQREYTDAMLKRPALEQPVIAVDLQSGVRSLNVNAAYTVRINQLAKQESEAVLPMLCRHVTRPEHCLRLHYDIGDICLFVSRLAHILSTRSLR